MRVAAWSFVTSFAWLCLLSSLLAQEQTPAAVSARSVRLRVAWGGGSEPRRWSGRIALSDGVFSDIQLLGMGADAAGSIWLDGNVIHVDAIRPHRFDGFDITASTSDRGTLAIELITEGMSAPTAVNVPVDEAARAAVRRELDDQKNVLLVHRAPGDSLRIETDRDSLIFAPGEEFTFKLRPAPGELAPGATVDAAATLTPARGGAPLWSIQHPRLPVPIRDELIQAITVPLPREEGVYTVRVTLAEPPGFGRFLPGGRIKPIAERTFQVVVLSLATEKPAAETAWQTVLEIDPSNRRWWQRLPAWALRLPGMPQGPLGSTDAASIDHPLGRFVELPPTATGVEPHWQAYPLPIQSVGVPHVVDVEYPADMEQHLGLSIVEPNASGRALPIGRDSGVYVESLGRSERTARHNHRLAFWPRTNSPLLLVSNLHPSAAATFGRIRVERASGALADSFKKAPWQSAQRLVTAYVARPLVPETFGATEGLVDAASGQSVDDWQTHFESARRLADYLPYAGYNGAVVSVFSDGSAIYPSRQLLSTPLYDTGRTVSGARGVPATDPLELMLRVFDRDGLAFIPAVQLASPLPALEALRRNSDPRSSGLEWVGADGQTWLESQHSGRGLAPYYNLLDDRVQQAVLDVVDELVIRYGHHAAFAGLAVQLSGDGYGQLPGLSWGLDDATIAQFERDTRVRLPAVNGPERFAARQSALSGQHLDLWRKWRAARVTRFYARLAALVQSTGSDRRLLLTTEDMFSTPRLKAQLRPNLLSKSPIDRVMFDVGIDRVQLEQTPGIVFCQAQYIEPVSPLVDRGVDLEINEATLVGAQRTEKRGPAGAMFFHRPIRARLESFDLKSPWQSSTWLVSQSATDAAAARKRFALALDAGDPAIFVDGGELLPMGQENITRPLLQVLQQLPTNAEFTVHRQQPVTLRVYTSADSTTLVVINGCPWPAQAEIGLQLPSAAELQILTAGGNGSGPLAKAPVQALAAGAHNWPVKLEPYEVQVVRMSVSGVRVAGLRATISDAAKAELEARLAELSNRDLTRRSEIKPLSNPAFEANGSAGPVPGWRLIGDSAGVAAELDATTPHGGNTCLYLSSRGALVGVESEPFSTPPTGQLFLMVWLRGENIAPKTAVRMVVETDGQAQKYRTFADSQPKYPLRPDWHPYGFPVNNLPLDSTGRLRVKFELEGAGEVWVDDVELYQLLFPEKSYEHSIAEKQVLVIMRHAAEKAHEEGRITDCVAALESYWPRFLLAYTSPIDPLPAIARQTTPGDAMPEIAEKAPAESTPLLKRLRWWQ